MGKGKADGDAEDDVDDLFGDVGSEDGSSDSNDDSESDEFVAEAVSRMPSRVGAAAGDMGDGLTLHEGRLVIEVNQFHVKCRESRFSLCFQERGGTVGRSRKTVAADARHILSEAAVGLSARDMGSDSDQEQESAPVDRKRGRGNRDEFGADASEEGQWGMSFKEKMRAKKYKKKGVVVQDGSMYNPFHHFLWHASLLFRFQAPRAGGDLSRANHQAPFAYVPLDKSAMKNKRDPNVRKAFKKLGAKGGSGH